MSSYQDTSHTSSEIISAIDTFFNCRNKIVVTTNPGARVTATCNNTILVSDSYSGVHHFYYDQFGDWRIDASYGQMQLTDFVSVEELKDYSHDMSIFIDTTLDNNSWQVIQYAARENIGSSYWPIGAIKKITLNGTVNVINGIYDDSMTFNNQLEYVYIISFIKDRDEYGNTGITFQGFKEEKTFGIKDIALLDSNYNNTNLRNRSSYPGLFYIDNSSSAATWQNCSMRTKVCGTDVNNPGSTFLSVLPEDLRAVLLPAVKKNYNNISVPSDMSYHTTIDYLFLLDATELSYNDFLSYGNLYEYYSTYVTTSDRRVKYGPISRYSSSPIYWWTRTSSLPTWWYVSYEGNVLNGYSKDMLLGFSPAFVVG